MDTLSFINVHEITPLKTVIEAHLLIKYNGYKTKPSIMK